MGVFRPSTRIWYFDYTHNGTTNDTSGPWAIDGDKPFAIDADWDGFADDVGVYRSSDGMWYFDYNRAGITALSQGPYGPTGPYWHTPSWDQPNDTAGYPVGCGNTAWAIVYAYWQRFKSKTNLFPGVDLSRMSRAADCPFGGSISNVMWEIGRLTETEYGENADVTLKWFFTRPTWYDPHHSVYDAYLVRF